MIVIVVNLGVNISLLCSGRIQGEQGKQMISACECALKRTLTDVFAQDTVTSDQSRENDREGYRLHPW